ncbi:MAG TPA: hypothetical protein VME92_20135 [Acetobacteraceae bacterium]|nr:hypothetical protein [Acetobacteraceae bacterium]
MQTILRAVFGALAFTACAAVAAPPPAAVPQKAAASEDHQPESPPPANAARPSSDSVHPGFGIGALQVSAPSFAAAIPATPTAVG